MSTSDRVEALSRVSLKPLPKPQVIQPVERVPKGMVRRSTYERKQFQESFRKT